MLETKRQFERRMLTLLDTPDARREVEHTIDLRDERGFALRAVLVLPMLAAVAWAIAQVIGQLPH